MRQIKNRDLSRAFAPIIRRILLKHMLRYASGGVIVSLGLALLICGVSFLMPIEALWQICIVSGTVLFVASLTAGWFTRPPYNKIAKAVDKLGLQEKVQTALELEGREDQFALLQRQDAVQSLNGFNRKQISINVPKQSYYIAAALVMSLALINFIPNPMDAVIKQKQQLQAEIEKQLEELKETADKELADNGMMTEEQQQELAKLVKELAEKLKGTSDYKEALKEISKAEDKLAALTEEIREQSLGQLTKQLASLDSTKALAAALSNMDSRDVESAVEQLKQQLENSENAEELSKELKDALAKAAEAMESGAFKDSLASIADSLGNGQSAAAMDELGDLLNNAASSGNAAGDVKYALQQMRNKVAKAAGGSEYVSNSGNPSSGESGGDGNGNPGNNNAGNQGNQSQGNQGQSGQGNGQNGQGSQGGQGNQGSGSGQGNQNGNGQGNQSGNGGQGNSGNSGQSGSGVGNGTTNQSSGQGGSGTTGSQSSQMGNENAQSTYEQIYAPERLGDGGEVSHVQGQQTDNGEVITEDGGRGAGDLSGYIPYKDVYLEYRSEAMTSMDRRVLPPSIQGLVRDYFSALGQ